MHRSLPNTTTDRVRWSVDSRYNAAGQPNGRPHVPGFLARSAAAPGSVVRSAAEWRAVVSDGVGEDAQAQLHIRPRI